MQPDDPEPRLGARGPEPFRLTRRVDGKLWLVCGSSATPVDLVRCFPWTEPRRFLSLRDAEGAERAFIRDLGDLDPESRVVAADTLRRSSFVVDVIQVLAVEEDFELRSFRVRAAHGERCFQTALDSWPEKLPDGALLLEDVYGDLYRFPSLDALDPVSIRLLWAFVD